MDFTQISTEEFITLLASKSAVPGGGGASSLTGAIGIALGNMVGSLTVGKKKYADVQEDILLLKSKADTLQASLLSFINQDALVFEPLSKAYKMPKDTEEQKQKRALVMEECLKSASLVPLKIMEKCGEALELMREFADKGSVIAISDAGVGAVLLKSALMGASLNVFINTKEMSDITYAKNMNQKANELLDTYTRLADSIYLDVLERLQ